jgi:hypothetical protein
VVGSIATLRQHFTMNFAGRSPVAAIDAFSLARLDGRWKIVSVVSDVTAPGSGSCPDSNEVEPNGD